jgi:hypothetical protein
MKLARTAACVKNDARRERNNCKLQEKPGPTKKPKNKLKL